MELVELIELIVASHNLHKVREIREMLRGTEGLEIFSLSKDYESPEETGETFAENAAIKAKTAATALGKWVLADDSGIVVPALDGEPGVRSARYAGEDASDEDNRKKLLSKMAGLKDHQRAAYFVCAVALAGPNGEFYAEEAKCEGMILEKGRGGSGFGYDPLFLKHDYNQTFAELDESVKNRISHRRKAIDKLLPRLETVVA